MVGPTPSQLDGAIDTPSSPLAAFDTEVNCQGDLKLARADIDFLDNGLKFSLGGYSSRIQKAILKSFTDPPRSKTNNRLLIVWFGEQKVETTIARRCNHLLHPGSPEEVLADQEICSVCKLKQQMKELIDWVHKKRTQHARKQMRHARVDLFRVLEKITRLADLEMKWNKENPAIMGDFHMYSAMAALDVYSRLEDRYMKRWDYPYAKAEQITQPTRVVKRKRDEDDDLDGFAPYPAEEEDDGSFPRKPKSPVECGDLLLDDVELAQGKSDDQQPVRTALPPRKKPKKVHYDEVTTIFSPTPGQTRPLRSHDDWRHNAYYYRRGSWYDPEDWAAPEDDEFLNTSGYKLDWEGWEKLGERLDKEADRWALGVAGGIFVGMGELVGGSQWVGKK